MSKGRGRAVAGLIGVILGSLLSISLEAQGPYTAQIQRALNAFLGAAHSWTGIQTVGGLAATGTTGVASQLRGFNRLASAAGSPLYLGSDDASLHGMVIGTNGFVGVFGPRSVDIQPPTVLLHVRPPSGNFASIAADATDIGGRMWIVESAGTGGVPPGAGRFSIYDNTADSHRLSIDTAGVVSFVGSTLTAGTASVLGGATQLGNITSSTVQIQASNGTQNNLSLIDTDAQTTGIGGSLNLGGRYDSSNYVRFAKLYAAKANGTSGNSLANFTIAVNANSTTNTVADVATFTSTGLSLLQPIASYKSVTTAGWGVPAIYAAGRAVAQTAAVGSVATYTVGAADGTFEVSANVLVTTATTHAFTVTCAYTDEGNTARTATLTFGLVAGGVTTTSVANGNGTVPYHGVTLHLRAKAATAITIATTGTFTTVTYNVEGVIRQIA